MPIAEKVYTLKDVSSHDFVVQYAQHLKKEGKMEIPKWVDLAKTGPFKELAPYDEDFYYIRAGAPQQSRPSARCMGSLRWGILYTSVGSRSAAGRFEGAGCGSGATAGRGGGGGALPPCSLD